MTYTYSSEGETSGCLQTIDRKALTDRVLAQSIIQTDSNFSISVKSKVDFLPF